MKSYEITNMKLKNNYYAQTHLPQVFLVAIKEIQNERYKHEN